MKRIFISIGILILIIGFFFPFISASGIIAQTSASVSIDMQPLGNNTFLLAIINSSVSNLSDVKLSFLTVYTNGTIRGGPFLTNSSPLRNNSAVAIDMINVTNFFLAYINSISQDEMRSIKDVNNSATIIGATTTDSAIGNRDHDVCIATLSNRSLYGYIDQVEGDFDMIGYWHNRTATAAVAEVNINSAIASTTNNTNIVDCHSINSTAAVFVHVNYTGTDNIRYSIRNFAGTALTTEGGTSNALDLDIGTTGAVAVTTLDLDKFAVAWYDGTDQDISMRILWKNATNVSSNIDINTTAGTGNRIDIATVGNVSGAADNIVVVWYGQASGDIMGATFDRWGNRLVNDFVIETAPNTTAPFSEISVMGKNPTSGFSLCNGTWAVAYTNSTGATKFKTYFINGTEWDGNGCPTIEGGAPNTCTYTSGNWEVNCADNCIITSNVALNGNNISITGIGVFTTEANITDYTTLTIKGTDISNKCVVKCFKGGCFRY